MYGFWFFYVGLFIFDFYCCLDLMIVEFLENYFDIKVIIYLIEYKFKF